VVAKATTLLSAYGGITCATICRLFHLHGLTPCKLLSGVLTGKLACPLLLLKQERLYRIRRLILGLCRAAFIAGTRLHRAVVWHLLRGPRFWPSQ